jgi:hypothetical protein
MRRSSFFVPGPPMELSRNATDFAVRKVNSAHIPSSKHTSVPLSLL